MFYAKKEASVKVKVVQATIKKLPSGEMEFTSENQTYVTVTEGTANLDYVSQAIQRKWGSQYVLVTYDGLKLDDSAQGMKVCSIHFIVLTTRPHFMIDHIICNSFLLRSYCAQREEHLCISSHIYTSPLLLYTVEHA